MTDTEVRRCIYCRRPLDSGRGMVIRMGSASFHLDCYIMSNRRRPGYREESKKIEAKTRN